MAKEPINMCEVSLPCNDSAKGGAIPHILVMIRDWRKDLKPRKKLLECNTLFLNEQVPLLR